MYKDQSARFLIKLLIPSLVIIWTGSAVADAVPYDIFGNIHVSLNSQDSVGNPEFTSNTSTLGIKGARKLPDHGLKLMFKAEWQYETTERVQEKSLVDRDQWVGVKGGFGTVLVGTATSNYKKTSSKVDPLWRTQLEGRSSFMQTSSRTLAAGAGIDRGRLTNSVNYKTPKMSGFQVAFNTTFSGVDDESTGIGLRHSTKTTFFFVDMFSDGDVAGQSETATKVGGFVKLDKFKISGQIESSKDVDGSDYWMLAGTYKLSKKGTLKMSIGEADGAKSSTSLAILYDYKLGPGTTVFVGYGNKNNDIGADDDIVTMAIRYKFSLKKS